MPEIKSSMVTPEVAARFWSKVDRSGECWEWTANRLHFGHGQFKMAGLNVKAHRVAYVIAHGDFDQTLCVCHRCDNPPCCNPDHLFLGSKSDNNRDAKRKGRYVRRLPRGEQHSHHALTDASVRYIRAAHAVGIATRRGLASMMGVSEGTINRCIRRESWAHVA